MSKALTRDQLADRKEKAVRFTRDVLDDPDRADEIEDESLEDYAARRKIEIINPRRKTAMATTRELKRRIRELEEENEELQDQLEAIADIVMPADEEEEEEEETEGEE